MKLHQLLCIISMCLCVWGGIFRPDHRSEKWSHCEGHLYKGWSHVLLILKKASAEFSCICHEEKCISVAIFPALRFVPVFWAYNIGHMGVNDLLEQDILRNIATWYIPPNVIEDLLRGKMHSLPLQVELNPSSSTTHVLSGVYHFNVDHMQENSAGYIRWITYHHTNEKGLIFEGALVQNSNEKCKWKWIKLKQLLTILSGVFLDKPIQILLNSKNARPLNLKGLEEIPDGFQIEYFLDKVMPCVEKMQVKDAEPNFPNVTPNGKTLLASDNSADMCSGLIHRTSAGLKRCFERMLSEKDKYTSSSPLLHFTHSSKAYNDRSDHRTQ